MLVTLFITIHLASVKSVVLIGYPKIYPPNECFLNYFQGSNKNRNILPQFPATRLDSHQKVYTYSTPDSITSVECDSARRPSSHRFPSRAGGRTLVHRHFE